MPVDMNFACRMAKASDVAYYIDKLGGPTSCPFYKDVGFTAIPQTFVAALINAALVGTTQTEVILAFRGTLPIDTDNWDDFVESVRDWVHNGEAELIDAPYTNGRVHRGFDRSLELLWSDVVSAVEAQHTASKRPVIVTGHSKGGAIASLAALRLQFEAGITPAAVFTFGSARAGDTQFWRDYQGKILRDWRFENQEDLVPHLPPTTPLLAFLAQIDARLSGLSSHGYHHVGLLEFLNWTGTVTEGSTFAFDVERLAHLAELVPVGKIQKVAQDHSLEKQYIPKLGP
jgi:hypothetical protein